MKNKDVSKQKIINAVGKIFRTEGQPGLYHTRIAQEAEKWNSLKLTSPVAPMAF